jgi:ribosome-dependent ATPase
MIDLSRATGDHLHLHPLHERGRALRPHLADARRQGAGQRHRRLAIVKKRGAATLEEAFIAYLRRRADPAGEAARATLPNREAPARFRRAKAPKRTRAIQRRFSLRAVQLRLARGAGAARDPVRLAMALLGSLLLMLVMGYGISMDVEDLRFAVLDRDQTSLSRDYALNLSGSRYFIEQPAIADDADLDRRMRSGELSLAMEIPPGFARDVQRGRRRRSAPGSTAPCRSAPKPCGLCAGHAPGLAGARSPKATSARASAGRPTSRRAFATTPTSRACRPWCRPSSPCCC